MEILPDPLKSNPLPDNLPTKPLDSKDKSTSIKSSEILKTLDFSSTLSFNDLISHIKPMSAQGFSWSIDEEFPEESVDEESLADSLNSIPEEGTIDVTSSTSQGVTGSPTAEIAKKILDLVKAKQTKDSTAFQSKSADPSRTTMPPIKPLEVSSHPFQAEKLSIEGANLVINDLQSQDPQFLDARGTIVDGELVFLIDAFTPKQKQDMFVDGDVGHFKISSNGDQVAVNETAKNLLLLAQSKSKADQTPLVRRIEYGPVLQATGIPEHLQKLRANVNKGRIFFLDDTQMDIYKQVLTQRLTSLIKQIEKEEKVKDENQASPLPLNPAFAAKAKSNVKEETETYTIKLLKQKLQFKNHITRFIDALFAIEAKSIEKERTIKKHEKEREEKATEARQESNQNSLNIQEVQTQRAKEFAKKIDQHNI